MKLVSRTASHSVTCQIEATKELHFRTQTQCALLPESVGYAACRFLRSSPTLSHSLAEESYRLRLTKRLYSQGAAHHLDGPFAATLR